jgi:ABC-type transporter lipoprotein component MlaA
VATLAERFNQIVESLPSDWTGLQIDLRIDQEDRYVEAAVIVAQVNGQPYSKASWHWRIPVAHSFGHAAAPDAVHGVLVQLDASGFTGDLAVYGVREGRVEVVPMWGRPQSVRDEFARRRSQ